MKIHMKITGHRLIEQKEKQPDGSVVTYDMLRLEMTGLGEDRKSKVAILVQPEHAASFPLGDKVEHVFEIRQGRLGLAESDAAHR